MRQTDRSPAQARRWWHLSGLLVALVTLFLATAGAGTAAAATLASDDFEDGNAAGWTTTGGTWIVKRDGSAVLNQSSFVANALARTGRTQWQDYTVTADVKVTSFNGLPGFVGVVARAQSTTTYYALVLRADDTVALTRTIGGSTSTLATARIEVSTDTWYRLSLTTADQTLTGSVGGVTLKVKDGFVFAGPAGLTTTWANASFDNVTIDSDVESAVTE